MILMKIYEIVENERAKDFTFDIAGFNRPYLEDITNKTCAEMTNENYGLHYFYEDLRDREVVNVTMDLITMKITILYR
jgi:hypothetical protein